MFLSLETPSHDAFDALSPGVPVKRTASAFGHSPSLRGVTWVSEPKGPRVELFMVGESMG